MNKLKRRKKLENQTDSSFRVSIHFKERKDINFKNRGFKHICYIRTQSNVSYFPLPTIF